MTRREHNRRMIIQRLAGILMLLISVAITYLCSTAVEVEDAGALLVTVPVGLYFLFSKKLILK